LGGDHNGSTGKIYHFVIACLSGYDTQPSKVKKLHIQTIHQRPQAKLQPKPIDHHNGIKPSFTLPGSLHIYPLEQQDEI
jgi:hypothetical protein